MRDICWSTSLPRARAQLSRTAAIAFAALHALALPGCVTSRSERTFSAHPSTGVAFQTPPAGASDNRIWHVDFALRAGHTKLSSTKQKLDRRLDLPLLLDVPGVFHKPSTPLDHKTDLSLGTLYVGVGRKESDWLTWTLYLGGGFGSEGDHQRFLNSNLEVRFKYVTCYAGLLGEIYPWSTPAQRNDLSWKERLQNGKPFLLAGFETGYVSAEGRGHFSIAPVRVYEDSQKIRDWLFSVLLGAGYGIPINDRWSLIISAHRAFHCYRPEEYDSWIATSALRFRF